MLACLTIQLTELEEKELSKSTLRNKLPSKQKQQHKYDV